MAYRAIQRAKAKQKVDPGVEYGRLPSFLLEFARRNPGSRVCCQLDSKGRFYRPFLSIGSVVRAQDAFLPVWKCDGAHMKDPLYNGICLSIIGKDGNKPNGPVAVAYIHKETETTLRGSFATVSLLV
ncbi:unnamed protein product [Phytophthora fragariaefolia]|uniref:Unnamed protein product n=1 Tax=Phytophthora fragariaefolia TaxID=1490495 RepID=A0A9W6YH33_9STRA|nr:unnamed protein product [Phytophthora fragariaefolia]